MRSIITNEPKQGSCIDLKPCGLEAACSQIDSHYICVCPHDFSPPNEDLKCPKRLTVPVAPKPLMNLSITKQKEQKQVKLYTDATVIQNNNGTVQPPISPSARLQPPISRSTLQPPISNSTFQKPVSNLTFQTPVSNSTFQPTVNPATFNKTASDLSNWLGFTVQYNVLVLTSVIAIFVLLLIILLIVFCFRKSSCCCKRKSTKKKSPVALFKNMIQDESYVLNPTYTSAAMTENKYLVPHFSQNSISLMKEIGQGFFGKVYRATLTHTDGNTEMVAIKVLKDTANPEAKEDFKRETEIMTYFRHPNILTLLGVCSEADISCPWMIFEYMPYGDLIEVLRNSNGKFSRHAPHLPVLDRDALLKISLQIAAGMKYLASQRFVHRDLACRNCLVGFNLSVKIADFGMSRDIYTCDYYTVGNNRMLPVRWMSPECIVYGKFTLESDVWSYGVVLWEIYSFGQQPYYGCTNDQTLKLVQDGVLLEIPLNCPPLICVLMNGCWKSDPKERLRFAEIHERLQNAAARADLDSPLPRPPALPAIVDHLSLRSMPSTELVQDEHYLRLDGGRNNREVADEYVDASV